MRTIIAMIMTLSLTSQAWCSVIGVPGPGQKMGGVYFFSGWKCIQGILTGKIDSGNPFPLAGNLSRPDTEKVCDNNGNNGWIAQFNFNRLSQGTHFFEAFDGAVAFAGVTFQVVHFGVEFKTGVSGSGTATLSDGSTAQLTWSQGLQGFTVSQAMPGGGTPSLSGSYLLELSFASDNCPISNLFLPTLTRELEITQTGDMLTAIELTNGTTYSGDVNSDGDWLVVIDDPSTGGTTDTCLASLTTLFGGNINNSVVITLFGVSQSGPTCTDFTCTIIYTGTRTEM